MEGIVSDYFDDDKEIAFIHPTFTTTTKKKRKKNRFEKLNMCSVGFS